jgi:hypothetical protein
LAVSPRSVAAASKVRQKGVPELVKAVERGKVKVSAAEQVSKLPGHRKPTFIGSVERGERSLSILNLRLIARKLRVELADLLEKQ